MGDAFHRRRAARKIAGRPCRRLPECHGRVPGCIFIQARGWFGMISLRIILALAALGIASCRKVPKVQTPSDARAPQAVAAETAKPAAAEERVAQPKDGKLAIDRNARVIVLGYHRFVDKVRHPDTEITPADFETQMQRLKEEGIGVISLKQFIAWRHGESDIPPKSALLTIDDGYHSAYDTAWPILKKYGYPFTLFIYTDYVKGGVKSGGGSLTWAQLAEMRDAGVAIQSHTVSHGDLRGRRLKSGGNDYEAWLWNELNGSREILEQKLGIKVTALAVPYGYYDEHVKEVAAKAGYEILFTVNGMRLTFDTPMNALGRYMIQSNQPKIFASAVNVENAENPSGATAILSAHWFDLSPREGETITDRTPLIRARLGELEQIEPGSVTLRMSGVGLLPVEFDPVTKTASCQIVKPLDPGTCTVIVSVRSDGRRFEGHWTFTVAEMRSPSLANAPR
jgi:peptidoglycan/xylan/chitin deacetylase (PgdA/CDA1 family)